MSRIVRRASVRSRLNSEYFSMNSLKGAEYLQKLEVKRKLSPAMTSYEEGNLNKEETVELFQKLIDSGLIRYLNGNYYRVAASFIDQGLCHEGHG